MTHPTQERGMKAIILLYLGLEFNSNTFSLFYIMQL